jgi:hypothetical protein
VVERVDPEACQSLDLKEVNLKFFNELAPSLMMSPHGMDLLLSSGSI